MSHPREDVVDRDDSVVDIGPFVEHHALSAFAHRRVADLGAGRKSALGKLFEYLGRPDHPQERGLAQPEYLLLQLGQPFVAALDG